MSGERMLVRSAEPNDLAALPTIERAADALFPPGALPSDEVHELDDLIEAFDCGDTVLVAEVAGVIVGFALAAAVVEDPSGDAFVTGPAATALHLHQLSVHPDAARRGIGSALLEAVLDDARARGCAAVGLTTFRSFAWNAPFYLARGFAEPAILPAALRRALEEETRMGFDPADRVALVVQL